MSTRGTGDTILEVTRAIKRDLVRAAIIGVAIEVVIWMLIRVGTAQWWGDWWYLISGHFWNDDGLPVARWLNALQEPLYAVGEYVALALFAHLKSVLPFRRSLVFFAYVGSASALVFGALMWTAAAFVVLQLVALLRKPTPPSTALAES